MRSICVAVALLAGVGCSKAQKDLEELEKRACACTDAKCGDHMADELMEWANKYKDDSVSNEDGLRQLIGVVTDSASQVAFDMSHHLKTVAEQRAANTH